MKLFNTLSKQKEEFIPLEKGKVKIYACGPTVYDFFHIGNARPIIVFDVLRRYFEYIGYSVTFVQNFTDIDDKMIMRANQENISVAQLGENFIKEYFVDADGLGVRHADFHPKATDHIEDIIKLVVNLEDKGFAYNLDGNVYFNTKKFAEYGKLSNQPLDELEAGVRVDVNEAKKDAMDFALWKSQKPGEPAWSSPWGMGRPGWHIECSAMSSSILGDTIDIHCGGQDLVFPHHENEIAQSEAATGKQFVRYWLHNGFINVDNQKMSKSAGNFFTVREIVKEFDYEVIRFFMLSVHYRSPINFSRDIIIQAKSGLERIHTCLNNLNFMLGASKASGAIDPLVSSEIGAVKTRFTEAMDEDLNTADAISVIFDFVRFANTAVTATSGTSQEGVHAIINTIVELGGVLGLVLQPKSSVLDGEIESQIKLREQARADKNWALADKIRDDLKAKNIILEDTAQGVKWIKE